MELSSQKKKALPALERPQTCNFFLTKIQSPPLGYQEELLRLLSYHWVTEQSVGSMTWVLKASHSAQWLYQQQSIITIWKQISPLRGSLQCLRLLYIKVMTTWQYLTSYLVCRIEGRIINEFIQEGYHELPLWSFTCHDITSMGKLYFCEYSITLMK